MKNLFRIIICLVISLLFIACEPSVITTPSLAPLPTSTVPATFTPNPSPTATFTVEPTSKPEFVPPTLIPTIDPTLVPGLLSKSFSVQTIEGINGHNMRQITGWDYGFGGGFWEGSCSGYHWLDADHLLLYPTVGQVRAFDQWGGTGVVPQPVVINVKNGNIWLPPANQSASPLTCNRVYWSRELEILITSEFQNDISTVSTYTYDGYKLANYPGGLFSVSPSGTKILIEEDTVIDLRTNKKISLNWSLEDYQEQILSELFWTSDETRVYRCCYFYADLTTGTSHRFGTSDFKDKNRNFFDYSGLWMYRGQWVQNDKYFLVWWSYVDDGDIRYLPMFDPAEKIFYDVREEAVISPDLTCPETDVSQNRQYLWIMCYDVNYLVDLSNYETTSYPGYTQVDIYWSKDSQFAWLVDYYTGESNIEILSVANKELKPLPIAALPNSVILWHPTDNVLVYPAKDKNTLIFLNASTMTYQELPFILEKPPHNSYGDLAWSPNGENIALIAEDNSLWQVDYPKLENLEQLTQPIPDMGGVNWSPDGKSIAFLSGSDIYIVETNE